MTTEKDFTITGSFNKSPTEVYNAINDVRGWWQGEVTGDTDKPGDTFRYQMKTVHRSDQEIIDMVPGRKVAWRVTDSNLSFASKPDEWTGTIIEFLIEPDGDRTKLVFTHYGLNPSLTCYNGCSMGWAKLIGQSLTGRINTGTGVEVF